MWSYVGTAGGGGGQAAEILTAPPPIFRLDDNDGMPHLGINARNYGT